MAEIMNWIGKIVVVPRAQLVDLARIDEVTRTGVYILAGDNPDNPSQGMVYIGESDNVWKRLTGHNKDPDKEFWERTVIIISKDENLTKAHVRYLESRLIQLAVQTKRARVANNTNPDVPSLPQADTADMEYFLQQVQILLPVTGFSFAMPVPTTVMALQKNRTVAQVPAVAQPIAFAKIEDRGLSGKTSPVFHLTYGGVDAYGQESEGEFVVLKGSTARKRDTPSLTETYTQIRTQLQRDGRLTDSDQSEFWVFTDNVPFDSPSAAACVAIGTRVSGRVQWKMEETGQTYADWQEAQIGNVEATKALPGNSF